jgi:hypothetical protein
MATAQEDWDAVSQANNADLIAYFGPVRVPFDNKLLHQIESRIRLRPNVILWLATFGGDPHAAYRISRMLQWHYKTVEGDKQKGKGTFTAFVDTICKSAGTIIVLGADRLVLSDYAELGPIELQLPKPDDGLERSSSLTPMQALNALQTSSFDLYRYYFRQLRNNAGWNLTTKTASEIAAKMTIGLMEPIYSQIDPIRLGEIDRFIKVSMQYGAKLNNGNLKEDAVERLVAGYPSHSFVIDRREAKELFNNVDSPDEKFKELSSIREFSEKKSASDTPMVTYLNTLPPETSSPVPASTPIGG